jgi:nucleoside phosphorylase
MVDASNHATHSVVTLVPLPPRVRDIMICVAMESEASPIACALGLGEPRALRSMHPARVREGHVAGARIRLVTAGLDAATHVDRIGPIYAATTLLHALAIATDATRPDLVINMGTAGGFSAQHIGIGDLVIARHTMVHDARVALPGFDALSRAHTRLSLSTDMLASLAARLDATIGDVSTGSSLDASVEELKQFAGAGTMAKDMELAALAMVARDEGVALASVKAITDLVDQPELASVSFLRNLKRACDRLGACAGPMIEVIAR